MPSKLTGLFKTLTWGDFGKPKDVPPPAAGAKGTAAFTKAKPSFNVKFLPVAGTKPPKIKLDDNVTVDVKLDGTSFVNNWVFTHRDQAFQDALLSHEQKHYDIGALLARDFFIDLMQMKANTYDTANAAQADFDKIKKDSIDKQKAVEKLYDDETEHGLKATEQTLWDGYIKSAFTTARPDGGAAPDGTKYKLRLLDVLRKAGKTI